MIQKFKIATILFILPLFLVSTTNIIAQNAAERDPTFQSRFTEGNGIRKAVPLPNGKILITGDFFSYDNVQRTKLARITSTGELDLSFNPGSGIEWESLIRDMVVLPDGKILIAGQFNIYNGVEANNIARLNADGSLDTTFSSGIGTDNSIIKIVNLPNGKILIGGWFNTYNGVTKNRMARLNADGSLDATFDVGAGANQEIYGIEVQNDGKIVVGGFFTTFNDINAKYIVRLHPNGSLDTSFQAGTKVNSAIMDVKLQPDGKILIAGFFTAYNNISRKCIARLNADGTLDMSFDPGLGGGHIVHCIGLQPNGKVLIGGQITFYNGSNCQNFIGLNADGSLDTTFDMGQCASGGVARIVNQADGKIIIVGGFDGYNSQPNRKIARLKGSCTTSAPSGAASQTFSGAVPANTTVGNLVVNGTNIKYYDENGEPLPANTGLVSGATYYVTQTINNCESPSLAVTVTVTLSLYNNSKTPFSYYPNPVIDKLNIISENVIKSIEIYNLYGQKVSVKTVNNTSDTIDMSHLPSASYLVRLNTDESSESFILFKK